MHIVSLFTEINERSSKESLAPIKTWEVQLLRSTDYDNGRLLIHVPGLYFVYSQIRFVEYQTLSGRKPAEYYSHYVYKLNDNLPNGGKILLLHNSQAQSWGEGQDRSEHTSYVGGVFHLNINDSIEVRVTNLQQVVWEPSSTYFGLYQISYIP